MSATHKPQEQHRIALVWEDHRMQAQSTYNGICRRAGLAAAVTIQCFDAFHLGFQRGIAKPLKKWSPDGVVARMNDLEQIEALRQMLPGVPFVSTLIVPPEIVETCVGSDIVEAIGIARDHFKAQQLSHMAMFCSANPHAAAARIAAFRATVPGGYDLELRGGDKPSGTKKVMEWLKSLPKPVGVMALEIGAGPFLLKCCRQLGVRVPQEVQIIGADDDDVSLACQPHLTSVHLPSKRIGERTMEVMLKHLRKTTPLPPPIISVSGSILVPRGSTSPTNGESSRIKKALQIMQSHARQDISMEQVAHMLGMGLTTFYKEFVNAMGFAPAQHMRQLRLEEAQRMLRESDATVTKIAEDCGFNSLISFVQFFRRQTGQTPSEYRESGISNKRL